MVMAAVKTACVKCPLFPIPPVTPAAAASPSPRSRPCLHKNSRRHISKLVRTGGDGSVPADAIRGGLGTGRRGVDDEGAATQDAVPAESAWQAEMTTHGKGTSDGAMSLDVLD